MNEYKQYQEVVHQLEKVGNMRKNDTKFRKLNTTKKEVLNRLNLILLRLSRVLFD